MSVNALKRGMVSDEELELNEVDVESFIKEPASEVKIEKKPPLKKEPVVKPEASKKKEKEKKAEGEFVKLSPDVIERWAYYDRPENEMGDESMDSLINSIRSVGQQVPILIRPKKKPEGKVKYEVLAGNRRWTACSLLGVDVLCILKDLEDKQAFSAMNCENAERESISPYARAVSWYQSLDKKLFKNQSELAAGLGVSRKFISRGMIFMKLPSYIAKYTSLSKLSIREAHEIYNISEMYTDLEEKLETHKDFIFKNSFSIKTIREIISFGEKTNDKKQSTESRETFENDKGEKYFTMNDVGSGSVINITKTGRLRVPKEEYRKFFKAMYEKYS